MCRAENRGRRPRREVLLGWLAPSHQLGGLGNALSSSSGSGALTFLFNFDCYGRPLVVLKPGCHSGRPAISTPKLLHRCLEVPDTCILNLITDNGNELHYCSQTQKYCMTNISFNIVTLPYSIVIIHCSVNLCLKNCHYFCLATTLSYMNFAIKTCFTFQPHLTSSSALPGKIENPKIVPFHLNAVYAVLAET